MSEQRSDAGGGGARPEHWLRGALPEYAVELQPIAHALLQAREDLVQRLHGVSVERLWARPGAAASAGFHVRHLAGSLDRLLTYARGEALSDAQRQALAQEKEMRAPLGADALLAEAVGAIDRALDQLRATRPTSLYEAREVGRARLPSTVAGLLFHAAEHTTRHVGQLITTLNALS